MEIITQSQAKSRGLERYNGKRCKNGHNERYTNSRGCVECARGRSTVSNKKPKPVKAAPAADAVPAADERPLFHRDPGQWCDPRKIDAAIERFFNDYSLRLCAAELTQSEAA